MKKNKKSEPNLLPIIDRSTLPNDVELLKDIIMSQAQTIARLTARIDQLEQNYAKLLRMHFGQSSEKLSTFQTTPETPFALLESSAALNAVDGSLSTNTHNTDDVKEKKQRKSRENHKGRNPFPAKLQRKPIEHDLSAHQKICVNCGFFLSVIGFEEREQLEAVIEKYMVLVHKRKKYACKNKKCSSQTIVTAPTPVEAIEKGCAGPNLLAEIIVDKYSDHLPLYRLQKRFLRQGIFINRSTLWSWLDQASSLLESLVNAMIRDQMVSDHMFADETTIPTLWAQLPENKGKQAKINYFWVYTSLLNNNKNKPIVVYRFEEGRGSEFPMTYLKNFKGHLQADAYSGYNPLFKPTCDDALKKDVSWCIEVGCFAHVRRYFMDALKANLKSIAKEVVLLIGDLYRYEADFKDQNLTFEQIQEKRQELSKPKLDEICLWLKQYQPLAPPKSLLGVAIGYALNNWAALCVYITDGRLEIDNSRAERNMKGVAVGRKNYLFVASNKGGKAAAILYSLVETCRQNGVNPKEYLADVLQRISTHPNSRIHELLPYHWQSPLNRSEATSVSDCQKVA